MLLSDPGGLEQIETPLTRTPAQHIHYSPAAARLSSITTPPGTHAADLKLYFLDSDSRESVNKIHKSYLGLAGLSFDI